MSRTDTAWRVIDAPPQRVYAAFVDPVAMARWLPPEGMTATIEAFDPRPGGAFCLVLQYAEPGQGKTSPDADRIEGEFVALEPSSLLVQRTRFESDDPAFAGTMTIRWRFDAIEEGTRVTVACEDVPTGIRRKDHLAGLRASLSNLAGFLHAAA